MKKTCLIIIIVAAGLGMKGWTQSNLLMALPMPTTNTVPIVTSVHINEPPVTNAVTQVPGIDTTQLVKQIIGADEITKQKVAYAIQAIKDGHNRVAAKQLEEVQAQTSLSTDQAQAVEAVLAQLR